MPPTETLLVWDVRSCPLPDEAMCRDLVGNLCAVVFSYCACKITINAYGIGDDIPVSIARQLYTGMSLLHSPRANHVEYMVSEMKNWAEKRDHAQTIFLVISGDNALAPALKEFCSRDHKVIVAHPPHGDYSELVAAATCVWDFTRLIGGGCPYQSTPEMIEEHIYGVLVDETMIQPNIVSHSEEEASRYRYFGYGYEIDEETSNKLEGSPGILFALTGSYVDAETKDYGRSPPSKKVKIELPPGSSSVKKLGVETQAHRYSVSSKPSAFFHMLEDSLLQQTIDGHSTKTLDQVLIEACGQNFHALQAVLLARQVHQADMKRLTALRAEHGECLEKMRMLEKESYLNLKAANDVQELGDFAEKVQALENKMSEDTQAVVTQQMMRTHVETMLEFKRGEWKAWDVDETVKIYNDTYPDDAFPLDDN